MTEPMMLLATGLAAANAVILLVLVYLFARIAIQRKALYPVGLVIFSVLLLAQNLLTVFAYVTMAPLFGDETLPFLVGISASELGGLAVLLRLTL